MISCLFLGLHYPQCILRVPHFCSKYTVPRSDSSLVSIIFQHIIIPEVSVLFVEFRSFFPHISALLVSNFVATRRLLAFCRIQVFFPHISALLLSNFVATDVYSLSLKILKPEDIFASKGAAVKEDGKLLDGTLLQADGFQGEPGKTGDENGAAPTATTKQRGE